MFASSLNRRAFLAGLGWAGAAGGMSPRAGDDPIFGVRRVPGFDGSGLGLPAIAAAVLPETLMIGRAGNGIPMRAGKDFLSDLAKAGCVEFRRYGFATAHVEEILVGNGIRPLATAEGGVFLFGFESLAHRETVWREFAVQREWLLQELAIYRGAGPTSFQKIAVSHQVPSG